MILANIIKIVIYHRLGGYSMQSVFLVVKQRILNGLEYPVYITINEGVFSTEELAKEYIKKRKALKDQDDCGWTFDVETWVLESELS